MTDRFLKVLKWESHYFCFRTAKNDLTYQLRLPEPATRMQNFLTELFENVQHLLSHFCVNIGENNFFPTHEPCYINIYIMEGYEFYQQPELATGLCRSVFSDLPGLPDFRLRAINRMFLKNFINKCPVEFLEPVLLPVLIQVKLVYTGQKVTIGRKSDRQSKSHDS